MLKTTQKNENGNGYKKSIGIILKFSKFSLKKFSSCNNTENSVAVKKITILNAAILNLTKQFMIQFHSSALKKNFVCNLLYSETDSLIYENLTKQKIHMTTLKSLR